MCLRFSLLSFRKSKGKPFWCQTPRDALGVIGGLKPLLPALQPRFWALGFGHFCPQVTVMFPPRHLDIFRQSSHPMAPMALGCAKLFPPSSAFLGEVLHRARAWLDPLWGKALKGQARFAVETAGGTSPWGSYGLSARPPSHFPQEFHTWLCQCKTRIGS